MGPGYLIRREPDPSDGYHNEKRADHDIKYNEPKEKQAVAKQTFGFPGSLTSKYPAKQDGEHEVRICECNVDISRMQKASEKTKRLRSRHLVFRG